MRVHAQCMQCLLHFAAQMCLITGKYKNSYLARVAHDQLSVVLQGKQQAMATLGQLCRCELPPETRQQGCMVGKELFGGQPKDSVCEVLRGRPA